MKKIFKISNLAKLIASLLVVVSAIALNPIGASAAWKQDNIGWWNTEGNSYSTGWRWIDGNWYYFDEYGYMLQNTIKDGYYLNNGGSWSNGGAEIQTYINLLNDTNWQRENGIMFYNYQSTLDKDMVGKSTIYKPWIIDIDQDGVYEMLFVDGTCDANSRISLVTYNGGDIKIEHLTGGGIGYRGYSSSQKVFFTGYTHMDYNLTVGYKLENGRCKQVYSSSSYEPIYGNKEEFTYTVDEQNVSKEEYEKSFEQFDEIVLNFHYY